MVGFLGLGRQKGPRKSIEKSSANICVVPAPMSGLIPRWGVGSLNTGRSTDRIPCPQLALFFFFFFLVVVFVAFSAHDYYSLIVSLFIPSIRGRIFSKGGMM